MRKSIRAERRTGELLKETAKNGQRQGRSQPRLKSPQPTLKDIGLSKDQSSDWQKLADIPKDQCAPVEIVPRDPQEDYKRMIAQIIEERIAEAMADASAAALQPFFQPRAIKDEIRRRQTVSEQRKWTYYFAEFGCLVCSTKDAPHSSLGMCQACLKRTHGRLKRCIEDHASAEKPQTFLDTVKVARKALAPSIEILAKNRREK